MKSWKRIMSVGVTAAMLAVNVVPVFAEEVVEAVPYEAEAADVADAFISEALGMVETMSDSEDSEEKKLSIDEVHDQIIAMDAEDKADSLEGTGNAEETLDINEIKRQLEHLPVDIPEPNDEAEMESAGATNEIANNVNKLVSFIDTKGNVDDNNNTFIVQYDDPVAQTIAVWITHNYGNNSLDFEMVDMTSGIFDVIMQYNLSTFTPSMLRVRKLTNTAGVITVDYVVDAYLYMSTFTNETVLQFSPTAGTVPANYNVVANNEGQKAFVWYKQILNDQVQMSLSDFGFEAYDQSTGGFNGNTETREIPAGADTYVVTWTKSVTYDGKKHYQKGTGADTGKKAYDVEVTITRNGEVFSTGFYKTSFKNNKKVGVGSFKIKVKGKTFKDFKKAVKSQVFTFNIEAVAQK